MSSEAKTSAGQSCRSCAWLKVKPDASGRRMPRKGSAYPCLWPEPLPAPLPLSITRAYGFTPTSRLARSFMSSDEGAECQTYQKIGDAARD